MCYSLAMESEATTATLRRIETALARIEAASKRVNALNSTGMTMNDLKARHDALRREAEAARDALSTIIANHTAEAAE
jgi:uncharacterized protein involved in exopolysaccharide biosynthesis